jgi:hypothetical protein
MSDAVFFIIVAVDPITAEIEAGRDFYQDEDDKLACDIKNREKEIE